MQTRQILAMQRIAVLAMLVWLSSSTLAQEPRRGADKYLCSEPHPESLCTQDNTCGAGSTSCTVDVKRGTAEAFAIPSIPSSKANQPFCVKTGTTVIWRSASKNTGFVVDFGPNSPFAREAIIGGSDRPISAVANKKGCYKYSAGACVSGSIYGMCASVETELIITGN